MTLMSVFFMTLSTSAAKVLLVNPPKRIEDSIDTSRYGANVGI